MSNGKQHQRSKMGRPGHEIGPGVFELLERYQGSGTVQELCKHLGIGTRVFYKWQDESADFRDAILRVRQQADDEIENALFKRAKGYDFVETMERSEEGGKDGMKTVSATTTKHIAPDTAAAMHWLKNRRPDVWRDRKEIEVIGDHVALVERFMAGMDEDDYAPQD